MNIENIEAFIYVIHYGSFNKAADSLFLSQPTVTARIQSLERELNCKLFHRTGKQVMITEEGKRFLPYAQQVVQIYEKGKMHINQKKSQTNELKIGCTVSVSNYVISEIIPKLSVMNDEVHYKMITGSTDELVKKTLNNEIDIAFVRKISHPSLQSIKLFEDPITLYVYKDHPFISKQSISIQDIAKENLIFFECGSLDWLRIHRLFENLESPPNIKIHTDSSEMAKKLILEKFGIAFLPSISVKKEVKDGLLYPIHIEETKGIYLQTNIFCNRGEYSELVNEIVKLSKELVK
ncbi:LysR family transcriptional regulator [Gottfriedia solisilvae]|uniref:HTH-type transcriptional regulator CitR n=1 Tax=Gottfriedia solisilvae TaxID=1516104 RepID=A0A8J3AMC7_9BACI|nr:LysR family transcriptional regulator [Gottfriedia solisilvae]GGI15405.1 HTH-type transcriptional regulator CitR [Gottfriedia solisilvae]